MSSEVIVVLVLVYVCSFPSNVHSDLPNVQQTLPKSVVKCLCPSASQCVLHKEV